jgi:hypothetical protein
MVRRKMIHECQSQVSLRWNEAPTWSTASLAVLIDTREGELRERATRVVAYTEERAGAYGFRVGISRSSK